MFNKEQVIQRIRHKHDIPDHIRFDVSEYQGGYRSFYASYNHDRVLTAVWRKAGGQLQTDSGWFKVNGLKLENAIERFMMHANDSRRFYDR